MSTVLNFLLLISHLSNQKHMNTLSKVEIIEQLGLIEHIEGGYFSETFRSPDTVEVSREGSARNVLTSIYYLLTDERPIGRFHMNQSDIVHYFQGGSALTYYIIHPDGKLEVVKLGNNYAAGEVGQMVVKGGCWKGTHLEHGEYGLLGEAVAPGFDYRDMRIATQEEIENGFPDIFPQVKHLFA